MGEPETLDTQEALAPRLQRHMFDRLLMLSDGVFAIAITLAAIEIRLPGDAPDLATLWDRSWLMLMSYFVSFFVIAIYWLSHRDLFARLAKVDPVVTGLTLAMLCTVSLIPASTQLLYRQGPVVYSGGAHYGPLRGYALVMSACGLINLAAWAYVSLRRELLLQGVTSREMLVRLASAAMAPLVFLILLVAPGQHMLTIIVAIIVPVTIARRILLPRLLQDAG